MIEAIVLGVIQGLAEFLPISSSGHLLLAEKFFSWTDLGLAFDAFLHLGTLLAVLIYFRKDIIYLIKSIFLPDREGRGIILVMIIAIFPAAVVGYFSRDLLANDFRLVGLVVFNLLFWGTILWLADSYIDRVKEKISALSRIGAVRAVIIGLAQVLALLPGTSRSGITITAALFQKVDRRTAARFSFLMSIPLIAAAGSISLLKLRVESTVVDWQILIYGFLASFLSGWLAVSWLMKLLSTKNLRWFAVYRWLLGIFILFLLWFK